ncbi:DUF2252 domain-containing protein [Nocardia jiangsuensis]|uniref:DUF2252 domain-containing protein n=1 Tax=Nocardia jiangsuensis TaxID=1691563 RepID=A0ABV8DN35_9NOCA
MTTSAVSTERNGSGGKTPNDRSAPPARAAAKEMRRAVRRRVPRSALGEWSPPADRLDPIAILQQQAATRVPELVPIRYARMVSGMFPFLRGAPAVMAADLAAAEHTGLTVQLCGDAHPVNFGLFASPERALVFDLNDFDETLPGPFEWDVKRLVAGLAVAARANGLDDTCALRCAESAAGAYRAAMREYAAMDGLSVWYQRTDAESGLALIRKPARRRRVEHTLDAARARTTLQAVGKLTEPGPDGPRIRHRPPLLVPVEQIDADVVTAVFHAYRESLPEDRQVLLDRYRVVDAARKVVGVGSVGTRCFIVLLADRDTGDPLFLQVKEAEQSVLAAHLEPSRYRHQGRRVVHGQRVIQSTADIFLGWCSGPEGRFFYWRQLRDMKGSADVDTMTPGVLRAYGALCGRTLARAHARSGDRVAIASYLGSSDVFDRAMSRFALAYADQTIIDHQRLVDAIASGEVLAAEKGW